MTYNIGITGEWDTFLEHANRWMCRSLNIFCGRTLAAAVSFTANIIDYQTCTLRSHRQRMRSANSPASSCDDGNFSL